MSGPRILVAGIGNIFFGDDGFGPEVARRLAQEPVPPGVRIVDFGIRGMHLAYELLDGFAEVILIDAAARGEAPGTLFVIEPDTARTTTLPDPHRMDVGNVFATVRALGGTLPRIVLLGCEPATLNDGIGLGPAVTQAVEGALPLARNLIETALRTHSKEDLYVP